MKPISEKQCNVKSSSMRLVGRTFTICLACVHTVKIVRTKILSSYILKLFLNMCPPKHLCLVWIEWGGGTDSAAEFIYCECPVEKNSFSCVVQVDFSLFWPLESNTCVLLVPCHLLKSGILCTAVFPKGKYYRPVTPKLFRAATYLCSVSSGYVPCTCYMAYGRSQRLLLGCTRFTAHIIVFCEPQKWVEATLGKLEVTSTNLKLLLATYVGHFRADSDDESGWRIRGTQKRPVGSTIMALKLNKEHHIRPSALRFMTH